MFHGLFACCRTAWRFRGYRPQPVTPLSAWRWLRQFKNQQDKKAVLALLNKVVFVGEREIDQALIYLNSALLDKLKSDGILPGNIIYVQHDDAGSSSPVMLNKVRDGARLQHLGCTLLDSRDVLGIHHATNNLGSGAIIYVDEFAGTGDQFVGSLSFVRKYIVGTFVEFLLVHTICEEAVLQLGKHGIEPFSKQLHSKSERPLHSNSNVLDPHTKLRLTNLSSTISPVGAFGYKGLASMVVFYNNAPDTVPLILRGNEGQDPFCGILPRITDLPSA